MQLAQFPTTPGGEGAHVNALHFGPDGQTLAAVWRAGFNTITVCWWDLRRQRQTGSELGANIAEDVISTDPALSPDHRFLARVENAWGGVQHLRLIDRTVKGKGGRDLTAWAYDDEGGAPESFNFQVFVALAFSPDGAFLFAAVAGGDPDDEARDASRLGIYRWSTRAVLSGRGPKSGGRLLPDNTFFLKMPPPDVFTWAQFGRNLVVSPDGGSLAAGLWNNRVLGWKLPAGDPHPRPRLKKRRQPTAWRLAFSPDGRTLAVADETVTLHDTASGRPRATLPPSPAVKAHVALWRGPFVFDLAYDPTGRLLATACGDTVVRWWDAATGAERISFDWEIGAMTAVAFSPDGRLCAAGGDDGRVVIWDVDE